MLRHLASMIGWALLTFTLCMASTTGASPWPDPARSPGPTAWIPTVVDRQARLWALPRGGPPLLLSDTLGHGSRITELAWRPSGHEVLLVRTPTGSAIDDHLDVLIRRDLTTGAEQKLTELPSGIKGASGTPFFGPGGDWAYIELFWLRGQDLEVFEGGTATRRPAGQFLGPVGAPTATVEGVYLEVVVGPATPEGRILTAVNWVTRSPDSGRPVRPAPGEPLPDVEGLYLVDRDLVQSERLTRGPAAWPIGLSPDGTWIAGTRCDDATGDCVLVIVDVRSGDERTLESADTLPVPWCGVAMAPDGNIAVATRTPGASPDAACGDLWLIDPADGSYRNVTQGAFAGFTAFAWAPPSATHAVDAAGN